MAKKAKKKGGKGFGIAIIGVAAVLFLGGGGATAYFLGLFNPMLGVEAEGGADDDPVELGKPVYYELPEFTADLKTGTCRSPFIKLVLTIQVDENDLSSLLEREPKIIDRFQQHLRSKERQELSGKEGAEILRTELTMILDATIKPAKTQNVLFRSLVVQ